jgi:hypothetical protein
MTELIEQGVTRMRLPFFNPWAYAEPRSEGPWADIYDSALGVTPGGPVPILIAQCDMYDTWQPAPDVTTKTR